MVKEGSGEAEQVEVEWEAATGAAMEPEKSIPSTLSSLPKRISSPTAASCQCKKPASKEEATAGATTRAGVVEREEWAEEREAVGEMEIALEAVVVNSPPNRSP